MMTKKIDNIDQLYNAEFVVILMQHLKTDSFGYEQGPEQRQLLKLTIDTFFPENLNWHDTYRQVLDYKEKQSTVYAKEWLQHLLNYYSLFLFFNKNISLQTLLQTKFVTLADYLLFLRKNFQLIFPHKMNEIDSFFATLAREIQYRDLGLKEILENLDIKMQDSDFHTLYASSLPELEPRSVVKFSETIRLQMHQSHLGLWQKMHWRNWTLNSNYWKMFFLQILIMTLVTVFLFFVIKKINHFYEKIILEKITLLEPNFLWLDTKLTFKNETDIPQKEIKLSSTQLDELEKLERLEQSQIQESEFFPESDIIDTSVAIGGWAGISQEFSGSEEEVPAPTVNSDYRDIYNGFSKAYRLMLNSADLFDMRQKLIGLFKTYKVKEANIPYVGKESLEGVYFNVYIPSTKIQQFIAEVGNIEMTNTYISKTSHIPPKGYERVFIWVKRI